MRHVRVLHSWRANILPTLVILRGLAIGKHEASAVGPLVMQLNMSLLFFTLLSKVQFPRQQSQRHGGLEIRMSDYGVLFP